MTKPNEIESYFSRIVAKFGITKKRFLIFLMVVVMCAGLVQGSYLISRVMEYQRTGRSYPEAGDFMVHYRWVNNVLVGNDPFYGAFDQEVPRLIFPGEFLWLLPFAVIPVDDVPKLMMVINLIVCGLLFWVSQVYGAKGRFGRWQTAGYWMVWFGMLLLSQPVMKVLSNGNVSLISSLLIFFSLMSSQSWIAGFCLSIASVMKISLVPFYGLVLLARRHYRSCFVAAGFFAVWCLGPFLYHYFNAKLYQDFFDIMFNQAIMGGYNTYAGGGGYDLINFDFFKYHPINYAVKLAFVGLFCMATWKEKDSPHYDLSYLLLVASVSSLVFYHRGHDAILVQLFLILLAQQFFIRRQWLQFAFPFTMALYLDIPLSWLMRVAAKLGQWIGDNSWVYLGKLVLDSSGDFVSMLPLPGINLFVVSLYAVYAYFGRRSSHLGHEAGT